MCFPPWPMLAETFSLPLLQGLAVTWKNSTLIWKTVRMKRWYRITSAWFLPALRTISWQDLECWNQMQLFWKYFPVLTLISVSCCTQTNSITSWRAVVRPWTQRAAIPSLNINSSHQRVPSSPQSPLTAPSQEVTTPSIGMVMEMVCT